jgi:hypothetical protein
MPLDEKAARTALFSHFNTEWPTVQPTVPVARPNDGFDPDTAQEWVRMIVRNTASRLVALSDARPNREWRVWAQIAVDVFVLPGTGEGRIDTLTRDCAAIWRLAHSEDLSGITTRAPEILGGSLVEDGAWYHKVVVTPIFYDMRG